MTFTEALLKVIAMKILVTGGGGREHALAWKLARDNVKPALYCAPGNAGTEQFAENIAQGAEDIEGILAWTRREHPDLVVVGPEAPLCAGIADRLAAEGIAVFGPCKAAAQIEGSKVFSAELMRACGAPAAYSEVFSDPAAAEKHAETLDTPLVVKVEGLAAGKGVSICETQDETRTAIRRALIERVFGESGRRILIEEYLRGEEASILALVDGKKAVMLASSQDHKRLRDGDRGPNTGGMGAYSPAPVVTDELWLRIEREIFQPVLGELRKRGIDYKGILYAGLMLCKDGPKILEFNCRFGDPETQALLPRLEDDLAPLLYACATGSLNERHLHWRKESCVCVVMAAEGYPGAYARGHPISGLTAASKHPGVVVFHAGTTTRGDGAIITDGGRVLGVTALGKTLETAAETAYRAVGDINFKNAHYRRDIAARALA